MGVYYHIGCLKCREWLWLGKMSEPNEEKKRKLWKFLDKHILHDLRVVGDDANRDEDLIKTSDEGWHYWQTDCKEFEEDDAP